MKKIISLFIVSLIILGLFGCSGANAEYTITFDIDDIPANFDPQLASKSSELMVVLNTFEGLIRIDDNDKAVCGVSESYTISDDGTVYTFSLRKDARWSDDEALVASDFVFAFKRALSSETKAPLSHHLFPIKNAAEVLSGSADPKELMVEELDEHTLRITLLKPDENFLYTLASSICMPIREDFFVSTSGKYGLDTKNIIGNGPFYVKKWSKNTSTISLRMTKNPYYSGDFTPKPTHVIIYFNTNPLDRVIRISENQLDSGYIPAEFYDTAISKDLATTSITDTSWAIYLNSSFKPFTSTELRKALAMATNFDNTSRYIKSPFKVADAFVPPSYTLGFKNYRGETGANSLKIKYDPDNAPLAYHEALKTYKISEEPFTIIYPEGENFKNIASSIAQVWQKLLGTIVTVKGVNLSTLKSQVKSGECQVALYPFSTFDNFSRTFLTKFSSTSKTNEYGFSDTNYNELIDSLNGATIDQKQGILLSAEKYLIDNALIIPVMFQDSYFASSNKVTGIKVFSSSGNISFINAERKK